MSGMNIAIRFFGYAQAILQGKIVILNVQRCIYIGFVRQVLPILWYDGPTQQIYFP